MVGVRCSKELFALGSRFAALNSRSAVFPCAVGAYSYPYMIRTYKRRWRQHEANLTNINHLRCAGRGKRVKGRRSTSTALAIFSQWQ